MTKLILKSMFSFTVASAGCAMAGVWDGRTWFGAAVVIFVLTSFSWKSTKRTNKGNAKRM